MKCRLAWIALPALLLASCMTAQVTQTSPDPVAQPPPAPIRRPVVACPECGRVERIETMQGLRATPRGGAVLGGVVGGVLAGPSQPAAPATPATSKTSQTMYRITVRMSDGKRAVINQNALPAGLRPGSPVMVRNWRVIPVR